MITFLDFEASGLQKPDSYPIEAAWADTLGNHDSFLILPEASWRHWEIAAQHVHKISRKKIFENGIPVIDAAERLNKHLGFEAVYCDALDFDGFWLSRLYQAAGIEPSFRLIDVHELYGNMEVEHVAEMQRLLKSSPATHRALADARRYVDAYNA